MRAKPGLGRAYARLLEGCGLLAGAAIGLLALLISADIFGRNLGLFNFPWLLEVSEYCLYVATFLAAPWVLRLGAHVRVDVLIEALPARAAAWLERLADTIGLAVSAVLLWYGWLAAYDAFRLGSRIAKELIIPEWWLLCVIPLSALLLVIEFALRLGRARAARTAPEGL